VPSSSEQPRPNPIAAVTNQINACRMLTSEDLRKVLPSGGQYDKVNFLII
jgi:hypothetical protein